MYPSTFTATPVDKHIYLIKDARASPIRNIDTNSTSVMKQNLGCSADQIHSIYIAQR